MTFIITRMKSKLESHSEVTDTSEKLDSPFFLYEDLIELLSHSEPIPREQLRWRTHSAKMLGLHTLSWGMGMFTFKQFASIYINQRWTHVELLGVEITYDPEVAVGTIRLERKPNCDSGVVLVGLLRTHLSVMRN